MRAPPVETAPGHISRRAAAAGNENEPEKHNIEQDTSIELQKHQELQNYFRKIIS